MRGKRIFFAALSFSLLAHLVVAANFSFWWSMPAAEISVPIEARLLVAIPTTVPAEPAPKKIQLAKKILEKSPPIRQPRMAEVTPVLPVNSEEFVQMIAAAPPPMPLPVPMPEPLLPEPVTPEPAEQLAPDSPSPLQPEVLRNLPEQISLRYNVQSGEEGFIIGQTNYSGRFQHGQYSLHSVTEATGISALFISGKIIQTSEGRVTAHGLQPTLFWSAKGKRSQPPVRFDWEQSLLLLPGGGVELPPQTQDLMSFPFHMAMLMSDEVEEWHLPVTNGKKLRVYVFQRLGREKLLLGESELETLHLRGERSGEGSLDVWLSPARNWLPVRIRTLDQKGKVIVLTLQADAP